MLKKIIITFLCVLSFEVSANEHGLGVSLKAGDPAIYYHYAINERLFVEPFLRYVKEKQGTSVNSIEFKSVDVGVGVFGRNGLMDKTQMYYGARFAVIDREVKYSPDFGRPDDGQDGYRIAPTIGFLYRINTKISVSAEAEWFFTNTEEKNVNAGDGQKTEIESTGTNSLFILRNYIN